jgi:hypothetical protein
LAWYDPSWLYRQKITLDHTLVAEYIVGTYDRDARPGNQRLYVNGTRARRRARPR